MLEPLERFHDAQPEGALSPDLADLWYLYAVVRDRRPETILEFGSGCSTAVLAAAVRENGVGHIWSLDADEGWAGVTAGSLPAELRNFVTVVHTPVVEEDRDVPGWLHRDVPDVSPDFLYLDSPPLTSERAVAFDPVDLEARFVPGFAMVIDGRHRNATYLREHLQRRYRVSKMTARYLFELVD
ncbi:MAG: class I SAM-dependent methyltransferase [Actinobacteria bacterium]|nr:class I SAM-dependent methyltransferase [Actinomycetota bacterium]